MSAKGLGLRIVVWAAVCLLAASDLGRLMGFMVGFGVAMFGGALGTLLQKIAEFTGHSLTWQQAGAVLMWSIVIGLAIGVLRSLVRTATAYRRGPSEAMLRLSKAVHLVGASSAIALSLRALERS